MRVGGLASGMDTDSIIKELMAAQRIPLDKLTQQKTFTEWQQEALRETNLAFSNLRNGASNLQFQSSFNSYSATSTNSGSVTVGTTANAMSGAYSVKVTSVASSAKLNSAAPVVNTTDLPAQGTNAIGIVGTFIVRNGTTENVVNVTEGMTFDGLAQAIQDATAGQKPELRANFDNTTSRFFITSKGMGGDQNFTMEFTDQTLADKVLNNGTLTSTTTNASYGSVEFDGIQINNLTTNKTTVNGLTLNLLQSSTETSIINVQSNPEKPIEMIKKFVESYNEIVSKIEKQLVEKRYPDFQPLSDEQKKDMTEGEIELWEEKARSGLLRNDSVLKSAMQELRRELMDPVAGIDMENINLLSEIGIDTRKFEGGKLFINETKLTEELTNNPDEVMELFTRKNAAGDGVGIGDKVYAKLNDIVDRMGDKAGRVTNSVDNSNISKKIKQMDEEISRWQDRLTKIEDRYWRQFTAMEKALSQMNSQSAWMQQSMFGGM